MVKRVLVTWQQPWQEIEAFQELDIEIIQIPLSSLVSQPHADLRRLVKDSQEPGRILIFSKAGVQGFKDSLQEDWPLAQTWRVATVGKETGQFAQKQGLQVDHMGSGTGLELVQELHPICPLRPWILPIGNLSRSEISDYLHEIKREFHTFVVYYNVKPQENIKKLRKILPSVDIALLASPSAAERLLSCECESYPELYSIGPTTSEKIQELGHSVSWQASQRGYAGFAEGLKTLTK